MPPTGPWFSPGTRCSSSPPPPPGGADQAGPRLGPAPRPRRSESHLGEGQAALLASPPLLLGKDVAIAGGPTRRRGRQARWHRPRVHPSANGPLPPADDGLLDPDAPSRRAPPG